MINVSNLPKNPIDYLPKDVGFSISLTSDDWGISLPLFWFSISNEAIKTQDFRLMEKSLKEFKEFFLAKFFDIEQGLYNYCQDKDKL